MNTKWTKVNELKSGMNIASYNPVSDSLFWDEILSIAEIGRELVYDVEIEDTHNFVGNDIFAHNTRVFGDVIANSFITSSADLAENYEVYDVAPVEAGDIVAVAPSNNEKFGVKRASQSDAVIGIISTKPGVTLGEKSESSAPVALAGRIPVKISDENGPVKAGDKITLSSIPGIGALATTSGQTVGIALAAENFATATTTIINSQGKEVRVGKIMVFVNLGYSQIDAPLLTKEGANGGGFIIDQKTGKTTSSYSIDLDGHELLNVRAILSKSGLWSIGDDGKILVQEVETNRLIVKDQATFGSQDKRIGITIYDETTGSPYCLKVNNGVTVTISGACSTSPQPPPYQGEGTSTTTTTSLSPYQGGGIEGGGITDTTPPTIQILGNNPATVPVGSAYSDNGALVTDNVDSNLGYKTYLNGVLVPQIQLDTSTTTTHSIEYRATDSAGNTGSATRVVNVVTP